MEWLYSLFLEHSALQAVVVLSLISAIGLGLGRVHFWGVSLGVTFVFFAGILAGHLGLSVDPQMLNYAESFGLVIFVYSLGLQVGPGFFSSFRKGGVLLEEAIKDRIAKTGKKPKAILPVHLYGIYCLLMCATGNWLPPLWNHYPKNGRRLMCW